MAEGYRCSQGLKLNFFGRGGGGTWQGGTGPVVKWQQCGLHPGYLRMYILSLSYKYITDFDLFSMVSAMGFLDCFFFIRVLNIESCSSPAGTTF